MRMPSPGSMSPTNVHAKGLRGTDSDCNLLVGIGFEFVISLEFLRNELSDLNDAFGVGVEALSILDCLNGRVSYERWRGHIADALAKVDAADRNAFAGHGTDITLNEVLKSG